MHEPFPSLPVWPQCDNPTDHSSVRAVTYWEVLARIVSMHVHWWIKFTEVGSRMFKLYIKLAGKTHMRMPFLINHIYCLQKKAYHKMMCRFVLSVVGRRTLSHSCEVQPVRLWNQINLQTNQRKDKGLRPIITYFEEKCLPNDKTEAPRIISLVQVMTLESRILYYIDCKQRDANGQLCQANYSNRL